MSSDEGLTELELKVLLQSRRKSIDEIAESLEISSAEVANLLESASRKIPVAEMREATAVAEILPRPRAFRLDRNVGQPQIGTMKVGSQILEILSKGIYSAPWNSIKELISNSFDASATRVDIEYFPEERKLVVKDDGLGMDYIDFDEHFTFITRSEKRRDSEFSALYQRPIIGKIGIGFIAASELCEQVKITSAKKGADTYFEALIDFARIRGEEAKEKEFYEVSQFILTNYEKSEVNEHYTKIELLGLKKTFTDILDNAVPSGAPPYVVKPTSFEDAVNRLCTGQISNIKREAGPYWEFLINLANVIPVGYLNDGPISFSENAAIPDKYLDSYKSTMSIIRNIKDELQRYNFQVFFNGLCLKKPVRFPNEAWLTDYGKEFCVFPIAETVQEVDPITQKASEVSYRGYFYYQKTRIVPEELRGMVVRIRNVAIGGPDRDLWGYPYPGDKLYLSQIYGEIYVDTGLEEAMNIDRSTFKTSHHEYAAMRKSLHRFLRQVVFTTAKEMYAARRFDKAKIRREVRSGARTAAVKQELGKEFKMEVTRKFAPEPVQISTPEQKVSLNVLSDVFRGFKKDDRLLLQDVSIALEIAMSREKDPKRIREVFWRVLRQLTTYRQS